MRLFKKMNAALALALTLALVAPVVTPVTNVAVAEAATIKLSKKKKNLKVGKSFKLKVKGTSEKATFTSSDETVAKVDAKGKVTAVSAGKTTITATVTGKEFTCKVTVKGSTNPAVANAPFEAKEVVAKGYSFVVPANWYSENFNEDGNFMYITVPTENHQSHIGVVIGESETEGLPYNILSEQLHVQYSEENIILSLESQGYENLVVSNYQVSDVETPLGTAFHIYYEAAATISGSPLSLIEDNYLIFVEDVLILVNGIDIPAESVTNPTTVEAIDYIVQSLMKK